MPRLEDLKKERLSKLARIKKAGIDPYPKTSQRTMANCQAVADFDKLAKQEKEIYLVGRIRSIRGHGGSTFITSAPSSASVIVVYGPNQTCVKSRFLISSRIFFIFFLSLFRCIDHSR